MGHNAYSKKHPQNHINDVQAAENHDRLRRVKANVGPLVGKIEDQPGDPPKQVAQQSCRILG
jgi:hypothetical protein